MTTSGPQTDPDDAREHRSIGQRIRDAVMGDPAETRRDPDAASTEDRVVEREGETDPQRGPADTGYGDTGRTAAPDTGRTADPDTGRTAAPDTGYAETGQTRHTGSIGERIRDAVLGEPGESRRDREADYAEPQRGADAGYADTGRAAPADTGYADPEHTGHTNAGYPVTPRSGERPGAAMSATNAGYADAQRSEVQSEAGFAEPASTADTTAGYGQAQRSEVESGAGYAGPAGSDVSRGDVGRGGATAADAPRRDVDRDYGGAQTTREYVQGGPVPDPVRDDVAQSGAPRTAAGADYAGTGQAAAPDDRDLVTSSYDPERDSGYDPQAAGTAMTGSTRDVRSGDSRDYDTRDYDPAADTGYLDEERAGADRATGRGDADYDTGRVDADQAAPDARRETRGGAAAGAVAAGGAAAAAGVAAAQHRRADEPGEGRFSEVDDTATVEPTSTGRATGDAGMADDDEAPVAGVTGDAPASTTTSGAPVGGAAGGEAAAADRRAEAVSEEQDEEDSGGRRERLVPADRAESYISRWDALKGDFVDEPRRAVAQADDLVGELLDEIQRLFTDQRRDLEQGFDHDRASTEDLRLALRRYRSFFDRLLSF